VSHASAQRTLAAEIRTALEEYGVSAFVAHDDIEPTEEWEDEISDAFGVSSRAKRIVATG
jgi:hypothetical protein